MVNKDQLEQSPEGQQVLALMEKNFTAEQFQSALTLIEQLYTEDQTVWDGEVNRDSKYPFDKTSSAQRLLLFFANPSDLAKVKSVLEEREMQARATAEEAAAVRPVESKDITPRAPEKTRVRVVKAVKRKPKKSLPGKKVVKRSVSKVLLAKKKQKTAVKKKSAPLAKPLKRTSAKKAKSTQSKSKSRASAAKSGKSLKKRKG